MQASLAGRYASALFALARDEKQIDAVSRSLAALDQALTDSPELGQLAASPLIGREDAGQALAAVAGQLGLDPLTTNFLGVLARNGRKGELRAVIRAFGKLAAEHRGETIAEVVSAHALDDDQVARLKAELRARAGREVAIEARIDPAILGGLVVKLGSQMIDASLRTKLNRFSEVMKNESPQTASMKG